MHLAISDDSRVQLKYFNECLLFDTELGSIKPLELHFYQTGTRPQN